MAKVSPKKIAPPPFLPLFASKRHLVLDSLVATTIARDVTERLKEAWNEPVGRRAHVRLPGSARSHS